MAKRWWTLIAVCAASFMLLVDITIVQVALPQIQRELHAGLTDLQWVIDAYALALASLILTAGALADRFGRRRLFVYGVAVFTVASMVCGLSSSVSLLVAGRVVQGIGGAAMFATSLALIGQEFSGRERGTAIAIWSSTIGGAVAIGPLLGGLLTDGIGWPWIFYVNVPVGVAAVLLSVTRTDNIHDPDAGALDIAGLVTFSGSLVLLVFAVLRGQAEGWSSGVIVGTFAGGAVGLVLFVVAELRAQRAMFDLTLLRNSSFVGVSIATFALGSGMFGLFLFITLYLQDLLGFSALGGGVRMLPTTLLVFVVPVVSRRFLAKAPPAYLLSAGLAVVAVGLWFMQTVTVHSTWRGLLPGMLLTGLGIGLANPAIAQVALSVVAPSRSGMASGINNTFRLAGVAVGIAGLGAIFTSRITTLVHQGLPQASPRLPQAVAASGLHAVAAFTAPAERVAATAVARSAFVTAFDGITRVAAVVLLVGALSAAALIRAPRRAAQPHPEAAHTPS